MVFKYILAGCWGAALWIEQSFSTVFLRGCMYHDFCNAFHTNYTICTLLHILCPGGTGRSWCCALLPLKNLEGSHPALAPKGLPVTWLSQLGPLQSQARCFSMPESYTPPRRRAAPSLPSYCLKETASEWFSKPPEEALGSPVCKTEVRSYVWSPAAYYTGCLVRFVRKLAVFPRKRAPFLSLAPAAVGDLRYVCKAFFQLESLGIAWQCARGKTSTYHGIKEYGHAEGPRYIFRRWHRILSVAGTSEAPNSNVIWD